MRNLIDILDFSTDELYELMDTAIDIIANPGKYSEKCKGKKLATLFFEPSTRTRLSFELAAKYLGGVAANVSVSTSSVSKGETLYDTAVTIKQMATDIIIIRHASSGAPHFLAKNLPCTIINAGDGMNEHPTQALLDALTIRQKKGQIEGLKVAIVGDIAHSRVAKSNIYLLNKLGADVVLGAPRTLIPAELENLNVKVYQNVEDAIKNADCVMGLRIQNERIKDNLFPSTREYSKFFGLDEKKISLAKDDAIIMHPGPVNRGVELSSDVVDRVNSVINEQVTNGVAVRMAVMYLLSRKEL